MSKSKSIQSQFDKDANQFNRCYAVLAMAKEVLRNGPSLMLDSEAMAIAEKMYDEGKRPEIRMW